MAGQTDQESGEPRRSAPMRVALQAVFAAVVIGALSLIAWERPALPARQDGPPSVAFVPRAAAAARPSIPSGDGTPRYALDDSEEIDPARAEPPRLNAATGRREDVLARGAFSVIETPYLRLTVTEAPADQAALFVTLARRAADGPGLFVARTGERGRIDSRFGPIETLETTLVTVAPEGDSRVCAGFVTRPPATIQIDGWLCAPLGQPPEPRAIACALDKLIRNGQASTDRDDAVRFAQERPRRDIACGVSPAVPGQIGSIGVRQPRNEARVRRTAQARP